MNINIIKKVLIYLNAVKCENPTAADTPEDVSVFLHNHYPDFCLNIEYENRWTGHEILNLYEYTRCLSRLDASIQFYRDEYVKYECALEFVDEAERYGIDIFKHIDFNHSNNSPLLILNEYRSIDAINQMIIKLKEVRYLFVSIHKYLDIIIDELQKRASL